MSNKTQKVIMLILTENCNLNCSYCYEHFKTPHVMKFETAKKIIDEELTKDDGYTDIIVEFFGGEPFLEFGLLKRIHDYIQHKKWNKSVLCFATTNGTLIHGEIKDWLYENRSTMCCGISLDGTREMHNINRNNSYDDIDINFYKSTWPQQTCKMTISRETLPKLAEGILDLHRLGYKVKTGFAQGINWTEKRNISVLEEQLEILTKYYIQNQNVPLCDFLDIKIDMVNLPPDTTKKWCGVGEQVKAYDINGFIYPCQAFAPQTLGEKEARVFRGTTNELLSDFYDDDCDHCVIHPICPTCYGANYQLTGNYKKRDQTLCKFNKLCSLSSSFIKYHRIKSSFKTDEMTQEQYLLLSAIEKIQQNIAL